MKQTRIGCFFSFLLILAARSGAQEYNTVPLDHAAYNLIAIGIARGIISPPPAAKPWSVHTVKQKLWEMIDDPEQLLSAKEEETVFRAVNSLERKTGLVPQDGRYRAEGSGYSFETGLGWESVFSVETSDTALTSVNLLKLYFGGDMADFASWNVTALGEFLYIERNQRRFSPRSHYDIHSAFPFASGKRWDGGVFSPRNPGSYAGWPEDPALAYGLEAELNGVFFNRYLQLRLGRVRRDWGHEINGSSLFLNARGRPFAALEGTVEMLPWLNVSFLGGALERFSEDSRWSGEGPFSNALTAGQIEFNPVKYLYLDIGGAAVYVKRPDAAFFADIELRLPDLFTLWGSFFVDRLNSSRENFFSANGNSYAYQAGAKTSVLWLPLTAFSLRYTKVEPYCYAAFISGGESLGYYLPPNSDELLLRFESMILPDVKFHVQFQMIRHGADYGYGAVPGSSLYDTLAAENSSKYFLRDGVYRWDNVVKLGGSFNLRDLGVPVAFYAETGVVLTKFSINGEAGIGNKADYEMHNDSVYRIGNSFVLSIGFRLFP